MNDSMDFHMLRTVLIIFTSFVMFPTSNAQSETQLDLLVHSIVKELQPHQLNIFADNHHGNLRSESIAESKLVKMLGKTTPVQNFDLAIVNEHNEISNEARSEYHDILKGPIIVLLHGDCHEQNKTLINFFDFYINIRPKPSRPRCLLVIFEEGNYFEHYCKKILEYAWSKLFLDVTVVEIPQNDHISVLSFNPFYRSFNKQNIFEISQLFPDKLKDCSRHKFILSYYHYPPFSNVKKNGTKVEFGYVTYYFLLQFVFERMNLLSIPVTSNDPLSKFTYMKALDQLQNNEVNLLILPTLSSSHTKNVSWLYMDLKRNDVEYGALMPILPLESANLPWKIVIYIVIVPAIFTVATSKIILPNFYKTHLNYFNILRILLGFSIPKQPSNIFNRVIFLFIFMVSTIYTIDIESLIKNKVAVSDEITLNSIEDVYDSNFTVFVSETIIPSVFQNTEIETLKNIESRIKIYKGRTCTSLLKEKKRAICIMSKVLARYEIQRNKKCNETLELKISNAVFASFKPVYAFEKASPYIRKIEKIFQQIYEYGIFKSLLEEEEHIFQEITKPKENPIDSTFLYNAIYISLCGYLVAFLVFLCECIYNKLF